MIYFFSKKWIVLFLSLFHFTSTGFSVDLDLLDNTEKGTKTLATANGWSIYGSILKGVSFTATQNLTLTNLKVGLMIAPGLSSATSQNSSGQVSLYNVDSSYFPTTLIAQVASPTFSISNTPQYFSIPLSGMNLQAGQSYALILGAFSAVTAWATPYTGDPPYGDLPSGNNGLTYLSTPFNNGGWQNSGIKSSFYLQGALSVPEPSTYAMGMIVTGLLATLARRRKSFEAG